MGPERGRDGRGSEDLWTVHLVLEQREEQS